MAQASNNQRTAQLPSTVRAVGQALIRKLSLVAKPLPLTDAHRRELHDHLISSMEHRGLPDIFITINPSDTYSPIVVRLHKGPKSLDLSHLLVSDVPNATERLRIVARDPAAAARFAHLVIQTFIRVFLGWGHTDPMKRQGLFGEVSAFTMVSENQGRGSIHWHGIITLRKIQTPLEIRTRFKDPQKRTEFIRWVDHCFRASWVKVRQCCMPFSYRSSGS
jgi:hypothetical protein